MLLCLTSDPSAAKFSLCDLLQLWQESCSEGKHLLVGLTPSQCMDERSQLGLFPPSPPAPSLRSL
ncbi:Hypothetical predicted protein [Podarcis lilfordi]|uniref:Uncharacterized protein n=1 Tax=Podarcis lilfordi TaxID=74358 RepID=A0AA35P429_9SAUR|nr:Hypothetical predicted protein [Podarcis lilfordi]